MVKVFSKKIIGTKIKYNILGIRISIIKNMDLKYIVQKMLKLLFSPIPARIRLFISSKFSPEAKRLYETSYKKYSYKEIFRLLKSRKLYPRNILSVEDTIEYVVENKCSIARIGDGEELGNILGYNCVYPELAEKLKNILANGSNNNCLVCINNFGADTESCPSFYRRHFTRYYTMISDYLENINFSDSLYGDAYAFYFYFIDKDLKYTELKSKLAYVKKIFDNKKILFVINENSFVKYDELIFNNCISSEYIYIPEQNAYSVYEKVIDKIKTEYDTSWLIYIEGGAMATVLAYECSELGYTALDMGSFYYRVVFPNIGKFEL